MQKSKKTKVGIVDSGIGGVAVLKKIIDKYHKGDFVYLADNKYMPYGTKTKAWLRERVLYLINLLKENYKVDYVIIACNTASTVLDNFNDDKVYVLKFCKDEIYLATRTTRRNLPKFKVFSNNKLVKQIESDTFNEDALNKTIRKVVKRNGLDCLNRLTLGCTHFELVDFLFKKYCPNTEIINNSSFLIDDLKLKNMTNKISINLVLTKEDKLLEYKILKLIYD